MPEPPMTSNDAVGSLPSTGLTPASLDNESGLVRPRNRRGRPHNDAATKLVGLAPGSSPGGSRGVSPIPSARLSSTKLTSSGQSSPITSTFGKGVLEGSWAPTWHTVQDFASSLLAGGEAGYSSDNSRPGSRNGSKSRQSSLWRTLGSNSRSSSARRPADSWGPAPPPKPSARPTSDDIAAGSLADREAALKTRKLKSALQSHPGVNGGLDVSGRFKRKDSDENLRESALESPPPECLAYLHHVQKDDTYAGVVLRYHCQEHAFRQANGLWSRDNIQIHKHLLLPVDACEVRGRTCDAPSYHNNQVDLLDSTPQPTDFTQEDYFSGKSVEQIKLDEEEPQWAHVRWVKIENVPDAVEIVRVPRKAMGYFPPRRKRSVHIVSSFSTPRHSVEFSRGAAASSEPAQSPTQMSSRRQSSLSTRPNPASLGTPNSRRSRGNSLDPMDDMPAWMRRPGGVGTMSRNVRAPGPANDGFNTWVNKRLPGFNIDTLPSMSVMGSETAQFGIRATSEDDTARIVESPFEDGRDTTVTAGQGMGLEQAAATVETWLRAAWAKRPSTPLMGPRKPVEDLDLIELADTNSDDGLLSSHGRAADPGLLSSTFHGSTARNDIATSLRGRSVMLSGDAKGKKGD